MTQTIKMCAILPCLLYSVTRPNCPGQSFPWDALPKKISGSAADSVDGVIKGDIVQFIGGEVFKAITANTAADTRAASVCEVTAVDKESTHPFYSLF